MKIASTLVILLVISLTHEVSAQRTRGRGTRQPTTKAASTKPATKPVAEAVPSPLTPAPAVAPVLLATVNGQNITTADLEQGVREEIESLPARIAETRRTILEMEINTVLLDSEANEAKDKFAATLRHGSCQKNNQTHRRRN